MLLIKVWCLPKTDEGKLNLLHQSIVQAVASVKEMGLESEKDLTCLFPADMMQYGLGSDIFVEIVGLIEIYNEPDKSKELRMRLAKKVGEAVHQHFPNAYSVMCFVIPVNESQGLWSSLD